jgi:hypothetical protein
MHFLNFVLNFRPVGIGMVKVNMQLLIMSGLAENMRQFAVEIIRHVKSGGVLNEAGLNAITNNTLANLKGTSTEGFTKEQEATFFKSSDTILREFIRLAVVDATTDNNTP